MIVNGKRAKKKKSTLGKSNDPCNPVWNEAFTFNFTQSNLQNASFEVCFPPNRLNSHSHWFQLKKIFVAVFFQIYVVSSRGESNAIGSCGIGPQEPGMGKQHWQDMIHNARQPIALWHHLR